MGSYGVIVCSRCRRATSIDCRAKLNTCPRCGKRNRTSSMRVFYRSNNQMEVAAAVSELNMELITVQ